MTEKNSRKEEVMKKYYCIEWIALLGFLIYHLKEAYEQEIGLKTAGNGHFGNSIFQNFNFLESMTLESSRLLVVPTLSKIQNPPL